MSINQENENQNQSDNISSSNILPDINFKLNPDQVMPKKL